MKKIAITVLTKGYNDIKSYDNYLIKRNLSIEEIIKQNSEIDYDFIILHEGNITNQHKEYISSKTPSIDIKFWDIKTTTPKTSFNDNKNIINTSICPPNFLSQNFSLGYKHMCHFWSIDFLQYFKDYKFIVRIDEDCIVNSFDFNIINIMEKNSINFISPMFQEQDVPLVIQGLEQIRNEFINEHKLNISTSFEQIKCPYTNFMIVNVENINKNNLIKEFLNKVDECGCIYSNRWGDLPIWGVILDTIMDKSEYMEYKNIKYHHGSHNKNINLI